MERKRRLVMTWVMASFSILLAVPSVLAQSGDEEKVAASAEDAKAQAADKKPVQRPMIMTGQDNAALAARFPDDHVWLETESEGRTLGLLMLESNAPARGAVLILADEGQTADSELAGALREPLSRAGWAAMTLGLQPPPYPVIKARQQPKPVMAEKPETDAPAEGAPTEQDENDAAPNDSAVMIDVMPEDALDEMKKNYQARIAAYLQSGVTYLKGQGYERVLLVGIGHGTPAITTQALSGPGAGENEMQGLVWVAPADTDDLAGSLNDASNLKVLELDSHLAEGRAGKARQAQLVRAGFVGYQRQLLAMSARPQARDARQIANRIVGWARSQVSPY
ncbi:DUF3530 family protein [Marinobacter sp. 1Y8]